jgi:hypothetical protein
MGIHDRIIENPLSGECLRLGFIYEMGGGYSGFYLSREVPTHESVGEIVQMPYYDDPLKEFQALSKEYQQKVRDEGWFPIGDVENIIYQALEILGFDEEVFAAHREKTADRVRIIHAKLDKALESGLHPRFNDDTIEEVAFRKLVEKVWSHREEYSEMLSDKWNKMNLTYPEP